jgi:hypothetical protein
MPAAYVAERAKGGSVVTTGTAKSFPISVTGITPGNLIFVALSFVTNQWGNLNVSDNQGNSYGTVGGAGGTAGYIVPFVAQIGAVAPTTITVTLDVTASPNLTVAYKVLEFTGVTSSRDSAPQFGGGATGTNVTIPSMAPAVATDLYIGFINSSVAQLPPSGITTGFTFAGTPRNAAPDLCAFYKIGAGTPTGAVTVAWNASAVSFFSAGTYLPINTIALSSQGLTVSDSIVRTTTAKPFGYVGERAKGGGTNIATGSGKTFTIPVSGGTVGNSLYLALYALSKLVTLVSVTDDVGNAYHIDQSLVGSGGRSMWIVSGYMVAAPTTLTITTNNSGGGAVAESYKVEEFSGGRNPPAFDTGYIEEETSAANFPSGAAVGGAGAGELYFYAYGADVNPGAYTPGGGMTQAGTARGANPDIVAEYNLSILNASASSVGSFATGSAGIGAQALYLRGTGLQSRTLSDTGLSVSDSLTTAYPVYTTPIQWLARGTRNGPWLVGGALYMFGNDGPNAALRCFKSTNGGKTWAEVDAAHCPTNTTSSYDTFLNGTTIWVEYLDAGSSTIHVRPFANDLWGADSPNGPPLGSRTNSGGRVTCIAGVRANGDVVITHQSTQETVSGTLRDRIGVSVYSGGVWVADQILGTGIAAHFDHVAGALGASDRVHMFYTRTDQTTSLQHRSLSSANVLDTEVAVATNLINVTDACVCGLAVGFVNGANTEIVVPYKTSGNILGVVRFFSQANPSVFTRTNVSTLQPDTTNGLMAAEVNATTVTVFFCDFASKDIYRNSDGGTNTWGTDTLVTIANDQWGVTAQPISPTQAGLVFSDTQTNTTILYLPVKTIPIQFYGRTPFDTGLSVSDTLAQTVNRTTMGDFGLLFSESLARSYIRPLVMVDTGLTFTDKLRKQPRPIDNGLNVADSIARTVRVSFQLQDSGLAFFDLGLTTSKPKTMTDTGLAVSTILRCFSTRPLQDTGMTASPDTVLTSQHALGLYVMSISGFGMTPGATDTLRLSKGIVRLFDTGVTVSDLFRHVGATQPVRGSRRWMAGHGAGSDMTR